MILFQKKLCLRYKSCLGAMFKNLNGPIIFPEEKNKIKSALVFLHGYGANGDDLMNIAYAWKKKLKNTVFISPNAPFTCDWAGNAFQWFELTSVAPEKIGEGLEKAGPFLHRFIEELKKKFSLNDEKTHVEVS